MKRPRAYVMLGRAERYATAAGVALKASYFIGGLSLINGLLSLGAAVLGKRYPDPFRSRVASGNAWVGTLHWVIITLAAYFILYRLLCTAFAIRSQIAFDRAEALREAEHIGA